MKDICFKLFIAYYTFVKTRLFRVERVFRYFLENLRKHKLKLDYLGLKDIADRYTDTPSKAMLKLDYLGLKDIAATIQYARPTAS